MSTGTKNNSKSESLSLYEKHAKRKQETLSSTPVIVNRTKAITELNKVKETFSKPIYEGYHMAVLNVFSKTVSVSASTVYFDTEVETLKEIKHTYPELLYEGYCMAIASFFNLTTSELEDCVSGKKYWII